MRFEALIAALPLSVTLATAQAPLNTIGSPTVIDFSTTVPGVNQGAFAAMNPCGSSTPIDGQLDFDGWNYTADAAVSTATQNAANFPGAVPGGNGIATGGSLTSGISAVDINGNRALAIQPASTHWTAGSITLRAQNNTTGSMEQLDVNFTVHVFNDAGRSNDVRFFYSLSAAQNSWVEVASAAVTSAEVADPSPTWVVNNRTLSISGFSINPGDVVYMRWVGNDVSGSGTRDEFALDDISLTPQTATGPLLISSETALAPFAQSQGSPSTEEGFVLFGANLTADALISAPAPFEVSLTSGSGFGASVTVPQVGGSITPTAVYARLNSASAGTFNGAITISSNGAGNALVGVSGITTGITVPTLFINELMATNLSDTTDAIGDHDPWFEIYNPTDVAADLAGWYVTNDALTPTAHQFPSGGSQAVVPAHGFLLVWADNQPGEGDLHTSFALSAAGGYLSLVGPDASTVVDFITYPSATADVSYGRSLDGLTPWINFTTTTPGATNNNVGISEANLEALRAWPSVVSDQINVSAPLTGQVISSTGSIVMQVRKTTRIDVTSLPEGSYMLRSTDGRVFRFVKVD